MTPDTVVQTQTETTAPATTNGSHLTNVVTHTTMTGIRATVMVVDGPQGSRIGTGANMGGTVDNGPGSVVPVATG